MTINLTKEPNAVSLTRHQIEYELQTDNFITVTGFKSLFVIQITSSPVVDDVFTLAWGEDPSTDPDESVIFTCKAAPDNSGTQYIDNAGPIPLSEWADLFFADLEANFLLTRDFDLTRTTADSLPAIQFQAKEKGLKFSMEFTESLSWIGEFLDFPGIDQVFQSNMNQVVQVHVEDIYLSQSFELKHEEQRVPDLNSKSLFDIHAVLDQFVESNFPTFNQSVITRCDKLIKRYFIRYYERFGLNVTEQKILTSSTKSALMGETTFEFFNQNKNIFTYFTTSKSFLTWQPNEKNITPEQHEFLYFPIVDGATTSIKSKVDIFYSDGSSDLDTEIQVKDTTKVDEIYIIPVGFDQVVKGVSAGAKTVVQYDIKVTDQADTVISELRRYYIYKKTHLETEYILFRNSIGAYETLRITGDIVKGLDITKLFFQTVLPSDYSLNDPEFTEFNVVGRENQVWSTGHMTKAELEHLQEFLLSESRFQISGSAYLPITLKTQKMKFFKTPDDLFAMTFEFNPAYTKNSVSDA